MSAPFFCLSSLINWSFLVMRPPAPAFDSEVHFYVNLAMLVSSEISGKIPLLLSRARVKRATRAHKSTRADSTALADQEVQSNRKEIRISGQFAATADLSRTRHRAIQQA